MTLICFASQKGSPGTTATALAVAAAMQVSDGRQKLLVEADSTGGTLAIRYRLPVEPGLLTLAAAVRGGPDVEGLWHHTQELPGGLRVVVSPDGPEQVHAAMAASGALLGTFLNDLAHVDVICDVGRLAPDSPTLAFVARASAVLMVARPNAEQLQPAARRMLMLRTQVRNVGWVLIGEKPYGPSEVEATYNFPVVGVIADDPRSVDALEQGSMTKKIRRSPFVRSSSTLARTLTDWLAPISKSAGAEPMPGVDDVASDEPEPAAPATLAPAPSVNPPSPDAETVPPSPPPSPEVETAPPVPTPVDPEPVAPAPVVAAPVTSPPIPPAPTPAVPPAPAQPTVEPAPAAPVPAAASTAPPSPPSAARPPLPPLNATAARPTVEEDLRPPPAFRGDDPEPPDHDPHAWPTAPDVGLDNGWGPGRENGWDDRSDFEQPTIRPTAFPHEEPDEWRAG